MKIKASSWLVPHGKLPPSLTRRETFILHVCDTEPAETRNLGRIRQLLIKGDPEFREIMEIASQNEESGDE